MGLSITIVSRFRGKSHHVIGTIENFAMGCQGKTVMNHLIRAREVFDIEIAALQDVRKRIDGQFERAVESMVRVLEKRGKIVIVGIGKSGNVGHKIAATLTSTGSTSVLLHSVDALHGDLGIVNDGDLILALS